MRGGPRGGGNPGPAYHGTPPNSASNPPSSSAYNSNGYRNNNNNNGYYRNSHYRHHNNGGSAHYADYGDHHYGAPHRGGYYDDSRPAPHSPQQHQQQQARAQHFQAYAPPPQPPASAPQQMLLTTPAQSHPQPVYYAPSSPSYASQQPYYDGGYRGHAPGPGPSHQPHHHSYGGGRYGGGGNRSPVYSRGGYNRGRDGGGCGMAPSAGSGAGPALAGSSRDPLDKSSVAAALAAVAKQRIFSDFRIARVKIGKFEAAEDSQHYGHHYGGVKDSRLRLYFRGSGNDTPRYLHAHNGGGGTTGNTQNNTDDPAVRDRALAEPDRLSISLYNGTKRIVIPVQDGLDKVQFRRRDGYFRIQSKGWALFEELDMRGGGSSSSSATFSQAAGHFRRCEDVTRGELAAAGGFIEVWTDLKRPLPIEPKWTRGNLGDYIDARSKYLAQGVLEVLDPEPTVDFDAVVALWERESAISSPLERQAFARTRLRRLPYLLELCSKILAPPYYYVSRALAATSNNPSGLPVPPSTASVCNGGGNGEHAGAPHLNTSAAASILESGQIPALISPAVNTLLATLVLVCRQALDAKKKYKEAAGDKNEDKPGDEDSEDDDEMGLAAHLKTIIFQVPEPIIWRSLDGLFAKRHERAAGNGSGLHFDADRVLLGASSRTQTKLQQMEDAAASVAALALRDRPKSADDEDLGAQKPVGSAGEAARPASKSRAAAYDDDDDYAMDGADVYHYGDGDE